jgi:excisionase family DNA binding protein
MAKPVEQELPGMPEAKAPAPKSREWLKAEVKRLWKFGREHNGVLLPSQAAFLLGISRQRVYQLVEQGRLHVHEFAGRQYIAGDEVDAFEQLERHSGFRYASLQTATA